MDKKTCFAVDEALEFTETMIEHALELGYLGEGSAAGMAKDALEKIGTARTLVLDEMRKQDRVRA